MDNKKFKLLLFFVFVTGLVSGQNSEKEEFKGTMKKVAKVYAAQNIKVQYTREIFENLTSEVSLEKNSGSICIGSNNRYRLEENGTMVIQNGDYKMSIDSTEKMVYISYPDANILPTNFSEIEKDSVLRFYDIQKKFAKNEISYELISKSEEFSSMTLVLNKNSFEIISLTYFLPASNYFSETLNDESVEEPLMVIRYKPLVKIDENTDLYSTKQWISTEEIPLELHSKITQFQIYDTRLSSH